MDITCSETNTDLSKLKAITVVARENDNNRYEPVADRVWEKIPRAEIDRRKHETYATGGVNLYHARISGRNGDTSVDFDHETDFIGSIPANIADKYIPRIAKLFPRKG